jgi:hypothetical protein
LVVKALSIVPVDLVLKTFHNRVCVAHIRNSKVRHNQANAFSRSLRRRKPAAFLCSPSRCIGEGGILV